LIDVSKVLTASTIMARRHTHASYEVSQVIIFSQITPGPLPGNFVIYKLKDFDDSSGFIDSPV
jgi:hypothetical protein